MSEKWLVFLWCCNKLLLANVREKNHSCMKKAHWLKSLSCIFLCSGNYCQQTSVNTILHSLKCPTCSWYIVLKCLGHCFQVTTSCFAWDDEYKKTCIAVFHISRASRLEKFSCPVAAVFMICSNIFWCWCCWQYNRQ